MLLNMVAIAFWPTVIGLALVGWLGRANPNVVVVTWVPAALIAVAGMIHTSIYDIASPVVLLNLFIGMALFGALCLLTAYGCGSALTNVRRLGLGLFGIAMLGYGGQMLIGDYAMERQVVEGEVPHLRVLDNQDMPSEYLATIGNGTSRSPRGITRACASGTICAPPSGAARDTFTCWSGCNARSTRPAAAAGVADALPSSHSVLSGLDARPCADVINQSCAVDHEQGALFD